MKNKITVNPYFNNISYEIIRELVNAKKSIWICVAWINFNIYKDVLVKKISEGIDVKIICNRDIINIKSLSIIDDLSLSNKVELISNAMRGFLVHHKFCIIDESTLINGSYNWSHAAYYHYENITVIKNDYKTVMKFKHEFLDLVSLAKKNELSHYRFINKKTSVFILGMMGEPCGKYETVTLQQWEVDLYTNECVKMHSIDIPNFYDLISTGLDDIDSDSDSDYLESKEYYIDTFNRERKQMDEIQKCFDLEGIKVDAIGRAFKSQDSKYEEEESLINIVWCNVRYRKIVPDIIDVDGDFDTVLSESYFAGT